VEVPDLYLIKQVEQGAKDRRGSLRQGADGNLAGRPQALEGDN
jgi:hypothetical protein